MNVHMNMQPLVDSFNFPKSQVRRITRTAIETAIYAAEKRIIRLATDGLNKTRREYIQNISRPTFVFGNVMMFGKLELTGMLPNMLEQGATAFDMKEGFRKSNKTRWSINKKNGIRNWYLTIPFRHATSGAGGFSSAFASKMPKHIEDAVKGKTQAPKAQGTASQGLSLNELYSMGRENAKLGKRARITRNRGTLRNDQVKTYRHKSPQYAGLTRISKKYESATQGKYMTFRRVSENSAANSWIHRGFTARNYFKNAMGSTEIKIAVKRAMEQEVFALGI